MNAQVNLAKIKNVVHDTNSNFYNIKHKKIVNCLGYKEQQICW